MRRFCMGNSSHTQTFMTHARHFLIAIAATSALSIGSTRALAQIVTNPASISYTAGNSYITDNVNHLDWYRFDASNNTVGLSYNQVLASSFFSGWSVASLDQVQGLETQFGWKNDTPTSAGSTPNSGLTDAMSAFLGLTGTFFAPVPNGTLESRSIFGMTSDLFFIGPKTDVLTHNVTNSTDYKTIDLHGGNAFFFGDYVQGGFGFQTPDKTDNSTGTWLVRTAANCTAHDCTTVTPEPSSMLLVAAGLLGLGSVLRRRARTTPRLLPDCRQ